MNGNKKRKWFQSTLTFSPLPAKIKSKSSTSTEVGEASTSPKVAEASTSTKVPEASTSTEVGEASTSTELGDNESRTTSTSEFICDVCGKTFYEKKRIIRHLRAHVKKKTAQARYKTRNKNDAPKRIQRFKETWLVKFPWTKKSKRGSSWVTCVPCNKELQIGKDGVTALKRHNNRKSHRDCENAIEIQKSDRRDMFQLTKNVSSITRRSRKLELMISLFIAKHNLALSLSDDLVEFIKNIDIDSNVQKNITCNSTKCSSVVKNVTGKYAFDLLVGILRNQKFTLIIDESTDVSSSKHLALVARYRREKDFEICDEFLGLLEVEDASSEGLYRTIVDFFEENEIPYLTNMVGFAADGASVMFGEHNSVAVKLKRDIPSLFVFKCICHSLALAVSYACKALPSELLTLFDDIHRYLKYSSKRQECLRQFQDLLNLPEHKILRFYKVRWLSLVAFVSRFIEQYDALSEFFQAESKSKVKKTADEAKRILNLLKNPYTLLYLHFLNFILPVITKRNVEFQSERPKVHELHRKMVTLFKTITSYYLKEEYVDRTDPELIAYCDKMRTPDNQEYWEHAHDVELGPIVTQELLRLSTTVPAQRINEFRQVCRSFYMALASQIIQRFPFGDPQIKVMQKFSFLDPVNLKATRNITEIATALKLDVEAVHAEFKTLRRSIANEYEENIPKFWKKVAKDNEYPLINIIVEAVMVYPHSSATVERAFSAINLNKTKIRNRLSSETLVGLLHSKKLGTDLYTMNYEPLIKLMHSDMYL